ncbi:zinc finger, CCHC-type containing protein [Tanacetum coccineum]
MLLTIRAPSSYKNFVETLLYGRESLTMEDVLATLNSWELKKRIECTKEEIGDGLYVNGRSYHSRKAYYGGSSRFKSRGGTSKLRCFICHSEDHMKRDCLMKKSSGNDEMTELVMDLGDKQVMHYQEGHKEIEDTVHDGSKSFYTGRCQYVPELRRRFDFIGVHGVQVEKCVWFEVELHGAQGDREAEVFQVSNDDAVVAQRRLEDKQPEENINTNCLVKEQEKAHLGINVWANITVTGVPGQEGAEGNVAEDKKESEKESKESKLGKLLKYNAWSTSAMFFAASKWESIVEWTNYRYTHLMHSTYARYMFTNWENQARKTRQRMFEKAVLDEE